jgi:sugar-specific transcriptional regulator TrmB
MAKRSSDKNKLQDAFEKRQDELEEEIEELEIEELEAKEEETKEKPKSISKKTNQQFIVLLRDSDFLIVKDKNGNGLRIPIKKSIENAKPGDVIEI